MSDNMLLRVGAQRSKTVFTWTIFACPAGGARRDRTDDLLLAKQALSQLSYGPSALHKTIIENR